MWLALEQDLDICDSSKIAHQAAFVMEIAVWLWVLAILSLSGTLRTFIGTILAGFAVDGRNIFYCLGRHCNASPACLRTGWS